MKNQSKLSYPGCVLGRDGLFKKSITNSWFGELPITNYIHIKIWNPRLVSPWALKLRRDFWKGNHNSPCGVVPHSLTAFFGSGWRVWRLFFSKLKCLTAFFFQLISLTAFFCQATEFDGFFGGTPKSLTGFLAAGLKVWRVVWWNFQQFDGFSWNTRRFLLVDLPKKWPAF